MCVVRGREGRRKSDGLAHRHSHVVSASCVLFPAGYLRQIPDFVFFLVLLRFFSFVRCLTLSFYSSSVVLRHIWRDLSSSPLFADELKRFVRRSFCSFPPRLCVLMGLCVRVCRHMLWMKIPENTVRRRTTRKTTKKKMKLRKRWCIAVKWPVPPDDSSVIYFVPFLE